MLLCPRRTGYPVREWLAKRPAAASGGPGPPETAGHRIANHSWLQI